MVFFGYLTYRAFNPNYVWFEPYISPTVAPPVFTPASGYPGSVPVDHAWLGAFPSCSAIQQGTASPGAENFTTPIPEIDVCAPPPPQCGQWGWLVPAGNDGIHGQMCPMSMPAPEALQIPPKPTCEDLGMDDPPGGGLDGADDGGKQGGCGCTASRDRTGVVAMIWGLAVVAGWRLRRRRHR